MKRRPIAFLLAAALVLQFCLVGALAADAVLTVDKSEGIVSVEAEGFAPNARLSLLAAYDAVPTFENLDYINQYAADDEGVVELDIPAKADLVGGEYYHVTLGGQQFKVGVPLESVRVHSSARVSVRIKAKAPLLVSADGVRSAYDIISSNPAIAVVTEADGKFTVQGLRAGTAIITIRVKDDFGGATHIVTVSVS
ncbi:MAG: hypothetical protein LBK75_04490 [Oscillospiraceae bacterium]|jgi:hypothetical protein|nr:hypothetical protein [Oscillospiraceae bacterium]